MKFRVVFNMRKVHVHKRFQIYQHVHAHVSALLSFMQLKEHESEHGLDAQPSSDLFRDVLSDSGLVLVGPLKEIQSCPATTPSAVGFGLLFG